jgi:hypothetical protein
MIGALHGVSGCCQCCPLRRRLFCGGCSWVEYQRIIFLAWLSWLCPGASTAVRAPALCGGVGCWERVRGAAGGGCVWRTVGS